jgi:hypothetical protein
VVKLLAQVAYVWCVPELHLTSLPLGVDKDVLRIDTLFTLASSGDLSSSSCARIKCLKCVCISYQEGLAYHSNFTRKPLQQQRQNNDEIVCSFLINSNYTPPPTKKEEIVTPTRLDGPTSQATTF